MQKLIANYASSDEDEEVQKTDSLTQSENQKQNLPQPSRLFSKLPPPKHSKSLDNETDQKIRENNSSHSSQSLQSPPETLQSSIQSTNVNNSKGSQKITLTLPIDTKKLQQKEEKEEDYLLPRPKKDFSGATGFLSFLPAPKYSTSEVPKEDESTEDFDSSEKKPTSQEKQTLPTPSFMKEDEKDEVKKDRKEQKQKSSKKGVPGPTKTITKKNPLSFNNKVYAQLMDYKEDQKASEQNVNYSGTETTSSEHITTSSQQASYQDPQQIYYVQQPQFGFQQEIPRDFRGFDESNSIGIDMNEVKKTFPKYLVPEKEERGPNSEYLPSKNAKRQHHISELLWKHQMNREQIQIKHIEGKRTRKETYSKYGW